MFPQWLDLCLVSLSLRRVIVLLGNESLNDCIFLTTKATPIVIHIFFGNRLLKNDHFFAFDEICLHFLGWFCRFFFVFQKLFNYVNSIMGGMGRAEMPAQRLTVALLSQFSYDMDKSLL